MSSQLIQFSKCAALATFAVAAMLVTGHRSAHAQTVIESEPNDGAAFANGLICNELCYGTIDAAAVGGGGDADWFRFLLLEPQLVTIDVTSRHGGIRDGSQVPMAPSLADSTLGLFDSVLTEIEQNDDHVLRSLPERGRFSRIRRELAVGTYYVRVEGGAPTDSGDYALLVTCQPPPPAQPTFVSACNFGVFPGIPETEPNNLPFQSTVTTAICCRENPGSINVAGDEDIWSILLSSDSYIVLSARQDGTGLGTIGQGIADTKLELRSADGITVLDFDDDGGPGLTARLEGNYVAGNYFVVVSGFASQAGDYLLTLDCGAPVPTLPMEIESTITYGSSGCAGSNGVLTTIVPQNQFALLGGWLRIELQNSGGGPGVALLGRPMPDIDLGIIGAPGCQLSLVVDASVPGIAVGPGRAEVALQVPTDLPLLGASFSQQWTEIDLGVSSPLSVTTSDRVTIVFGHR